VTERRLTVAILESAGAFCGAVKEFEWLFPLGAPITRESAEKGRELIRYNTSWLATNAQLIGLTEENIYAEYWKRRTPIYAKYLKQRRATQKRNRPIEDVYTNQMADMFIDLVLGED